uniref:Uncharacterized protein LOC104239649 isoform X2 n=1 Tax=Nicotiana sylvestris TaxID=4096 RepID=A0A1U7Y072_NICSY|nr:PREDICTED: uncharacterized protein LOC104239649 isoform X2 [Nicotiana sylvestris]
MRRMLMISVGCKWKEWKHEAKMIGYEPYNNDIERLAKCPDKVEEDQWRALVHYWSSNEAKENSERNKESRRKLSMPHTSGRKSHSQSIDDVSDNSMDDHQQSLSPVSLFHTKMSQGFHKQLNLKIFPRLFQFLVVKFWR